MPRPYSLCFDLFEQSCLLSLSIDILHLTTIFPCDVYLDVGTSSPFIPIPFNL
jgi:hypothetical protein